jgi:hypothetical protein
MMNKTAWAIWGLVCLIAGPAMAQPAASAPPEHRQSAAQAERQAERERIHQERQRIAAIQKRDETACYRRFAVEDCLKDARTQARNAELQLRARELRLNDAERREKAAERLRSIEEKQRLSPDRSQPQGSARGAERPASASVEELRTQHQREAQQRAQLQRTREQSGAENKAQRAAQSAERAAAARARHADNVKAAQERRERVQKMQAESAAAGRKPAASLPTSSGLPPVQP